MSAGRPWRARIGEASGAEGYPAVPEWDGDKPSLPHCSGECPRYDGKRCELTGVRAHPGALCEPVVAEMTRMLDEQPAGA